MRRRCKLNKGHFGRLGMVVVILLLALTPILGCAAPEEAPLTPAPVVKPDKVVIYHFGDLSGPIAAASVPVVTGLADGIEWLNTEKGGVRGVPIEIVYRDTGGNLDTAIAAYAAFLEMEPRPFLIFTYGSDQVEALRDRVVEDEILNFTMSGSPFALYPPGYTFATLPAYTDQFGAFVDWVVDDWAKKTGEKVKLAILTWDNSFGRAILVDETRQYAADKGVEIVAEEVFGVRDLDVSTLLTGIKAKGANWVYDNTTVHGPTIIHKNAEALGMLNQNLYDTTPGMIHRASGPWGIASTIIQFGPAVSEGAVGVTQIPFWTEDHPGVRLMTSVANEKERAAKDVGAPYLIGFMYADTMVEAIGRTVDAVGWDNLTGSALREQFMKMENYRPFDLYTFTFTADKPEPSSVRIVQVQDGIPVPITDWFDAPDLKPVEYR